MSQCNSFTFNHKFAAGQKMATIVTKSHYSFLFSNYNMICGSLRARDTLTWNKGLILALTH